MSAARAPRILVVAAFLMIFGQIPLSAVPITIDTFTFVGPCADCTGFGIGTLVLTNYTLGNAMTPANFTSFTYTSNLTSFSLNGVGPGVGQIDSISGLLPAILPSSADISFTTTQLLVFQSAVSGTWCAGINGCNLDFGIQGGTWQAGVIPEPATSALIIAGFGALTLLRRVKARRLG